MTPRRACFGIALSILLGMLPSGCGGESGTDAGPPDAESATGVVLTVTAAAARATLNGVAPRPGNQYYLLDVTLEARGVGPVSIAPVAFEVELGDGTRVRGDADRTNAIGEGCRSRTVPVDETVACRVAFIVAEDAAAPTTLRWADASYAASAPVPPIE
jgi:hypothetical protein